MFDLSIRLIVVPFIFLYLANLVKYRSVTTAFVEAAVSLAYAWLIVSVSLAIGLMKI